MCFLVIIFSVSRLKSTLTICTFMMETVHKHHNLEGTMGKKHLSQFPVAVTTCLSDSHLIQVDLSKDFMP